MKYLLIICIAIMLTVTGCASYLVDNRSRPNSYRVTSSDANLIANVKAALIKSNQIDAYNIRVTSIQNIVTLYGSVKSSSQMIQAVQLARAVNGVKKVNSKLIIIK